jgi:hypothetical protein
MGLSFSCSFSGHSQSTLQFDPGSKSLQFLSDPNPQFTHEVSPSWIDDIPLVNLIVEAFGNGIAEGIQEESPFCSLAREPPQSVAWNGVTGCDVKEAASRIASTCAAYRKRNDRMQRRKQRSTRRQGEATCRQATVPRTRTAWDTVFAINYTDVNNAIATSKSFPPKFDFEQESDDGDVKMTGTFDAWQIILGGDGQNLWMSMDCPTVAFQMGSVSKSFAAHVEIEVQLGMLPQPKATNAKGKNDLKMKSTTTPAAALGPPPTVVTVRNAKCTPDPGVIVNGVFPECLATWFNQNLQAFNHVFATVDLDADLAKDSAGFKWLMPTHTSYAVVDQGTMDSSVFAVLSMTEYREPTRLNHQVSPNAIPTYARAGFLISRERFLEKMVLPGVPALFVKATDSDTGPATTDDFDVDDDGASITNVKSMNFQDLKLDDGKIVHPDIDAGGFSISLSEQTFTLQLTNLHFVYTPGIDVYIQYTSDCSLAIDKDNRIALKPKKMTHKGTVTTTLDKQVIEIATSIAASCSGR